jgi:hypothetical protein
MNEDKGCDPSASALRTMAMDVDSTPTAHDDGKTTSAMGVTQVPITPYNHSPSTPRGERDHG